MKKMYETPAMDVVKLMVEDIVSTSGICEEYNPNCPNESGRD